MRVIKLECIKCGKQVNDLRSIEDTNRDDIVKLNFCCESCGKRFSYRYPVDEVDYLKEVYKDSLSRHSE